MYVSNYFIMYTCGLRVVHNSTNIQLFFFYLQAAKINV